MTVLKLLVLLTFVVLTTGRDDGERERVKRNIFHGRNRGHQQQQQQQKQQQNQRQPLFGHHRQNHAPAAPPPPVVHHKQVYHPQQHQQRFQQQHLQQQHQKPNGGLVGNVLNSVDDAARGVGNVVGNVLGGLFGGGKGRGQGHHQAQPQLIFGGLPPRGHSHEGHQQWQGQGQRRHSHELGGHGLKIQQGGQAAVVILQFLQMLIQHKIIEATVATDIAVTAGVKLKQPFVPNYYGKVITYHTINTVQISGDKKARTRFIYGFNNLLENQQGQDKNVVVSLLIHLAISNKIIDENKAKQIAAQHGIKIEQPSVGVILSAMGGKPAASKKFINALIRLIGGKPIPQHKADLLQNPSINLVLDLLIENNILDRKSAAKLALSVDVGGRPEQLRLKGQDRTLTLNALHNLHIGGIPEGREEFLTVMATILNPRPPPPGQRLPSKQVTFTNALADLLEDNDIIDDPLADQLISILGLPRIRVKLINKEAKNTFGIKVNGNKQAGEKFITSITVIFGGKKPGPGVPPGNVIQLISILLDLLVANNVLKQDDATDLAVTFGITVTVKGKVLSTADITQLQVSGEKDARDSFVRSLTTLLDVNFQQKGGDRIKFITNMIIKLTVQNKIIDADSATKLISYFTYQGGDKPSVFTIIVKGSPAAASIFIVSIRTLLAGNPPTKNSLTNHVFKFATSLLTFLVANNMLTQNDADRLSITFGIQESETQDRKLTPGEIQLLNIQGKPEIRQKVITILSLIVDSKSSAIVGVKDTDKISVLISVLLDLASGNDLMQPKDVDELVEMLGITDQRQTVVTIVTEASNPPNQLHITLGANTHANHRFLFLLSKLLNVDPLSREPLDVVNLVLDLLIDYKIIGALTSKNLAVTFGYTGKDGGVPYTLQNIRNLQVAGTPSAKSVFIRLIKRLIDTKTAPGGLNKGSYIIRIVVDLATGNGIIDESGAIKLLEQFGAGGDITKFDHQATTITSLNITVKGNSAPSIIFVSEFETLLGDRKPTENVLREQLAPFANLLLQLLAGNRIFTASDSPNLATTFGVTRNQATGEHLTKDSVSRLTIGGNPKSRDKFFNVVNFILSRKSGPADKESHLSLTTILLEILVDNDVVNADGVVKLGRLLGLVEYPPNRVQAGEKAFIKLGLKPTNIRGLVVARPTFFATFDFLYANRPKLNDTSALNWCGKVLFKTLVANCIFDQDIVSDLVVRFGATPIREDSSRVPVTLNPNTIKSIIVGGQSKARTTFVNALHLLLSKNFGPKDIIVLKKHFFSALLQLFVDNGISDVQTATKFAAFVGVQFPPQEFSLVNVNIHVKGNEGAGQMFLKSVHQFLANAKKSGNYSPTTMRTTFINLLLQLLVGNRIIDSKAAANLVATFSVKNEGQFEIEVPGTPTHLTHATITHLQVGGKAESKTQFIVSLKKLIKKISSKKTDVVSHLPSFIDLLLKLIIDNKILEQSLVVKLAGYFDVHYSTDDKESSEEVGVITVSGDENGSKKFIYSLTVFVENKSGEKRNLTQKASTIVNLLIQLLIDNGLIDRQLAVDLIATFSVPQQGKHEISGNPRILVPSNITTTSIGGKTNGRLKLVAALNILYDQKVLSTDNYATAHLPSFVKILLQFGVDNDLFTMNTAEDISAHFGVCYVFPTEITSRTDISIKFSGNTTAGQNFADAVVTYHNRTEPHDVTDSSVTLINLLLRLLVENNVLDSKSAADFSGTFSIFDAGDYKISTNFTILTPVAIGKQPIGGSENGRKNFIEALIVLWDKKSVFGSNVVANLYTFVNILLQLTVDNFIIAPADAEQICSYFDVYYYTVDVQAPAPDVINKVPIGGSKDAGKKFLDSITVYITTATGKPKDVTTKWSTLVNLLLRLFINNRIIDQKTAGDLSATFSIIGSGQHPLIGDFTTLTKNLITSLKIDGSPAATKQFITAITVLLEKKQAGSTDLFLILPNFIKILLQLAIDNSIIDKKDAGKIAVHFSVYFVGVDIVTTVTNIVVVGGDSESGKEFIDTITIYLETITKATDKETKLVTFTNLLLRLLIDNSVLDVHTAGSLLATFATIVHGDFPLDGAWEPYSPTTILHLTISGNVPARTKFISSINILLDRYDSTEHDVTLINFIKILLQLVVENEILESRFVIQLANRFGITFTTHFFVIEKQSSPCCGGGYSAALDSLMTYEASRRYFDVASKEALSNVLSKSLLQAGVIESCMT